MSNRPQISPERKAMYYLGAVLMGIGILLFLSNFFIMPMQMSRMPTFGPSQGMDPIIGMAMRAIGGMVLMVIGAFVRGVGARGAAGSGLILDPEQAREDLKPWAQTAGGLVKDALDEVRGEGGHAGGGDPTGPVETVVKVRCPKCRTLNDEDAKFCKSCASAL